MSPSDDDLPFGLYERLVTASLKTRLLQFDARQVSKRQIDPAESHLTLAGHIQDLVSRALSGVPETERLEKQAALVNSLVDLLARSDVDVSADAALEMPAEELLSIQPVPTVPDPPPVTVPLGGLSKLDLLINARGQPSLAHALAHEIPSADSIDLLCAFVRWHGLRLLEPQLAAHCRAGKPLRVIATVYTGSTERKAIDWLVAQGAEVKISYDINSTRLHAKAWLFCRATGFSTAYIGSSNLSKAALVDGVEWKLRLSQVAAADVLDEVAAAFETYWQSPEYESYNPARDRDGLDRALSRETVRSTRQISSLALEPWPRQRGMLVPFSSNGWPEEPRHVKPARVLRQARLCGGRAEDTSVVKRSIMNEVKDG